MRRLILVANAALAIAACGKKNATDTAVNADQELAVQNITANDTTAIDAVTGDDANMAADVDYTINETDNIAADNSDATANSAGNNATKAVRPICESAATAASAAAPSPVRSPPAMPRRPRRSPSAGPGNGRIPNVRARLGSMPACGQTSFSSSPLRWTTSVPALGLMHSQSSPSTAGKVPLLSAATRNPRCVQ